MALVMNPANERFEGDSSSYGNTFDNNLREGILVDLGEAVNTGSQQATTDDDFFNELDKLKKSENDGAEEEDKKKKKDRKPRSKSGKKKQAEESQQQQAGTPDANGGYKYPSYKERRKLALVTEPAPVRSPVVPAVATSPDVGKYPKYWWWASLIFSNKNIFPFQTTFRM